MDLWVFFSPKFIGIFFLFFLFLIHWDGIDIGHCVSLRCEVGWFDPHHLCSLFILPFPRLPTTTDPFPVSIFLLFPECHRSGIIKHVGFSDGLLSLSDVHLTFFVSPHGFRAHFSSVMGHIPLCRWTTAYLSIYLLIGILVICRFWRLWIKLLETSSCRFLHWQLFIHFGKY